MDYSLKSWRITFRYAPTPHKKYIQQPLLGSRIFFRMNLHDTHIIYIVANIIESFIQNRLYLCFVWNVHMRYHGTAPCRLLAQPNLDKQSLNVTPLKLNEILR